MAHLAGVIGQHEAPTVTDTGVIDQSGHLLWFAVGAVVRCVKALLAYWATGHTAAISILVVTRTTQASARDQHSR